MRLTRSGLQVLKAFLDRAGEELYGYDIMQVARISSGTLYPLLIKLEAEGLLSSGWENVDPAAAGRPRRRLYRITAQGQRAFQLEATSLGLPFQGAAA